MNKLPPFMTLLKQQGTIRQNLLTFRLDHVSGESDMIIGGEDPSFRASPFTWHAVTQQAYWMIKIDAIKVGGTVVASNLKGIVDTGTSLIVGGANTIGKAARIIVAQNCSTDVSTLPEVTFTLDGKD